jgi:MFS family permease
MSVDRTGRRHAQLPRSFWYLFYGMIINRLGAFMLPFLALYLIRRGLSPAQAGTIVACYGIGTTTSAIGGGTLADRWGRRPTMVASLLASAALTAPLGWVTQPVPLATLAIVLGLTANVYRPAANAAIADLVPPAERVRAFGLLYWAENLGFSAAALTGGLIASHSFALLFVADGTTSAIFAVVIARGLRDGRLPVLANTVGERGAGLSAVLGDRVFLAFVALTLAFMWIYFQTSVGLPVGMARAGLGPARYGLVLAANGVTVVAFQPAVSLAIRRMNKGHALAAAAVLLGGGFGILAWVHGLPMFAMAIVVMTLGEIIYSSAAPALIADLSPAALRGRYQGVWGASIGLAAITGPAIGGMLIGGLGVAWLWHVCLGLGLVAGVSQLALARSYQTASAAAEQVVAEPVGT